MFLFSSQEVFTCEQAEEQLGWGLSAAQPHFLLPAYLCGVTWGNRPLPQDTKSDSDKVFPSARLCFSVILSQPCLWVTAP